MTEKRFKNIVWTALGLVYLVIFAGAVVRMTGSGMGCPDWPKCFGYLIPPTHRAQLDWKPQHEYKEGEVIIVNESLRVAKQDFTSSDAYNETYWSPYTKHDYALFNPYHTWIEFVNRLLGVLAGLATLAVFVGSLLRGRKQPKLLILSTLVLLGMAFQAWLGKTVVDSNLMPAKITLHMGMALILIALLILILQSVQTGQKRPVSIQTFRTLIGMALVLSLIQIGMGTQVRQFIDLQMHDFPQLPHRWLENAPAKFYIHRSFSLLVMGTHLGIWWMLWKNKIKFRAFGLVLSCIGLEIFSGALMYYFDFPFSTQPIHLLLATLMFGGQFYLLTLPNPSTQI